VNIVVLGSINIDFVVKAHRIPRSGETILGKGFFTSPGGKGANQAVAAARMGTSTKMIGRVGGDVFGKEILRSLESDGIDAGAVAIDREAETGTALITVADDGANTIVVVPGANAAVGRQELDALEGVIHQTDVLMLQLEIPVEVVESAASIAASSGVTVILDPAPARPLTEKLLGHCTWITPNAHEAETLAGFPVTDDESVIKAAKTLLSRGASNVVITLGGQGCYFASREEGSFVEAPQIEAVDTVGAGDAFNGALAVGLAQRRSIEEVLTAACSAGARASTLRGAQSEGSS
jgi:ribokinase